MKIYKDFEQKSEEWFNVRLGKWTASTFHIMLGNSETKKTNLIKKACEIITGDSDEEKFSNKHTERGIELEAEARYSYAVKTGNIIENVAFIEKDEFTGCSPDGLIGDEGVLEIKCPCNHIFLDLCVKGEKKLITAYKIQMQFNMMVSGRKWCDFAAYNPNFKDNSLLIIRFERDEEKISEIEKCLEECNKEVQNIIKQLLTK